VIWASDAFSFQACRRVAHLSGYFPFSIFHAACGRITDLHLFRMHPSIVLFFCGSFSSSVALCFPFPGSFHFLESLSACWLSKFFLDVIFKTVRGIRMVFCGFPPVCFLLRLSEIFKIRLSLSSPIFLFLGYPPLTFFTPVSRPPSPGVLVCSPPTLPLLLVLNFSFLWITQEP